MSRKIINCVITFLQANYQKPRIYAYWFFSQEHFNCERIISQYKRFVLFSSSCYTIVSILLYRIRIPRICQYLKPGRHDSAKNCHRRREAFFSIFISFAFRKKEKNLQRTRFYIEHKSKSSLILVSSQNSVLSFSFEIDFTESP